MIRKKIFYRVLVFSIITGCAGVTKIPDSESPGARLYTEKCIQCHSLPHPKRFRFHEWEHFVKLMEKEMKKQSISLSQEDKNIILGYLQKHAR